MTANYIFLLGTGRSGTHLVGRTIGSHLDVFPLIESGWTFKLAKSIAVNLDCDASWFTKLKKFSLFSIYRIFARIVQEQYILEKSHPALWFAEDLATSFPEAKFVAVWRNLEPTVASMLLHRGVIDWYNRLNLNVPNRFLGITAKNVGSYSALEMEEKSALRWAAHRNEIERLKPILGNRMIVIQYDDFLRHPNRYIDMLSGFLGLNKTFLIENLEGNSATKWRDQLSEEQLTKIRKIIELND